MKKLHKKQIAWSQQKVANAKLKYLSMFLMVMLVAIAIPSLGFMIQEPASIEFTGKMMAGPIILFSMASIGNVDDVSDKETAANKIACKVWLVETCDIDDTVPFPQPNAARQVSDVPMKAGRYMYYFEAHDVPTDNSTGEKGDITIDATNTFVIVMGGNRDKLLDFIEQKAGGKFVVIYQEVDSGEYFIQGTYGRPMVLKAYDRKKDKEATAVTYTFENKTIQQPKKYIGAIVRQDPVAVATDATDLAITANDRYELPNDNTAPKALATVSSIAPADYGRYITVYGTGGANAHTIADNAAYVLVDGATWTGNAGSRITFRIQDSGTLVEIDRVQT